MREAVSKNVLLLPAVTEDGCAMTAVWRDVNALVAFRTTGEGGRNKLLSTVGESPWYIQWNKVCAPTCLLCWMAFLPREVSCKAIILTIRLWMASSLPSDISKAAIHTDEI